MVNEFLSRNDEIVDGSYRLGALIKRSIRSTVYKTEFGEEGLPAVIKIRESESPGSEELLERWRNGMELAHPNLLKLYATGSSVLNGVPVVYVVMERADESLNNILAERALTGDETRELVEPTVAALRYLHKKGYAYSGLGPSNVLAVQDQLKLSSENAIRVNDGGSTTEDMRALGVLIVQALTQHIPNGHGQLDPDILRKAPDPFPRIVEHCLDPDSATRWTAEQVEAAMKGTAPEPVPPIRTPPVQKVTAAEAHPTVRAEREAPEEARSKTGIPKWIYAGIGALILIVVLAAVMRKRDAAPVAVVAPAVVSPAVAPEQTPGAETAAPQCQQKYRLQRPSLSNAPKRLAHVEEKRTDGR